jgi:NAD(P)-dependent dehydrogenase (short-subunit alcohol dehydrogenase family)
VLPEPGPPTVPRMRVLITGAARAIGAATAQTFLEQGWEVVATARRPEALADVAATERLQLDVTDQGSVSACIAAAGPVDVLVNNAAIAEAGPVERYPVHRLQATFDTNVVGAVRMVQAVVPGMRERGSGAVVNISSVQGRVASPLEGAYAASKFALEAISEAMHYELNHFGIRTAIIEPGFIAPGMKESPRWGLEAPYDELGEQWFGADATLLGPDGRPGPELVAAAVFEAATTDAPRLRWPVGADAELIFATRDQLDDDAFEATMRETLGLTW